MIHVEKKQNAVAFSLSDVFDYVGCSADWVNPAWEIDSYSGDYHNRQWVIVENDTELSYSVLLADWVADDDETTITEIATFQFYDYHSATEILAALVKYSMKLQNENRG